MNPQFGTALLVLSLAALFLTALFFIICRRYEDGIVGLPALLGVGGASGLMLWDWWRGVLIIPQPEVCLLIVCAAVFLLRHGYRFAMFHWHGKFGWGRPRDFDPESTVPNG